MSYMKSLKKIADRLYRDGNNCTPEQKDLRFLIWSRYLLSTLNRSNNYKLSSKEEKLLKTVTGI